MPTPRDGIISPIAFKVPRRHLRGFLAAADALETGSREITAEWVINKRLWKRMQGDFCLRNQKVVGKDRIILYLHGGAYYSMSAQTHRLMTIQLSKYTESRVLGR